MSDPQLRKRKKKSATKAPDTRADDASSPRFAHAGLQANPTDDLDVDLSSIQKYVKVLWIPLLVCFGVFIYLVSGIAIDTSIILLSLF